MEHFFPSFFLVKKAAKGGNSTNFGCCLFVIHPNQKNIFLASKAQGVKVPKKTIHINT